MSLLNTQPNKILPQEACLKIISMSRSGSCFSSRNPAVSFTPSMLSSTKSSAISCNIFRVWLFRSTTTNPKHGVVRELVGVRAATAKNKRKQYSARAGLHSVQRPLLRGQPLSSRSSLGLPPASRSRSWPDRKTRKCIP